ncbi:hypothetical protein GCM10022251_16510 [Phytohabitans flavus]|uniref:RNA polymerase sigma factor n=1 Tax=Phytohabitans flavus TaxID=1076124 RepID=A0A6F8Y6E2_9ACTN|nr:sigma-70 family RNA polymerase sigma factor [Phytohabitans flavus]BCB81599.1 RNA polymerase sigma factor [Phytohabitans flavus]
MPVSTLDRYAALDTVDAGLVHRSAAGDDDAFATLIARYRGDLEAFAGKYHDDPFDRDDLVQETMIKAWRRIAAFDGRSTVRTWLYRITANAAVDGYRQRGRRPAPTDDPSWLDRHTASAESVVVEEHQLRWALALLPERYRVVSVLADRLGCPYAEIAELCHIPEATVRTLVRRSRSALRAAILRAERV